MGFYAGNSGEMKQLALEYIDDDNMVFSNGIPSREYRITAIY